MAGIGPFTVTTEQYYLHMDPAVEVLAVTDYAEDPDDPELAGASCRSRGPGSGARAGCSSPRSGTGWPTWTCLRWTTIIRRGMAWATR